MKGRLSVTPIFVFFLPSVGGEGTVICRYTDPVTKLCVSTIRYNVMRYNVYIRCNIIFVGLQGIIVGGGILERGGQGRGLGTVPAHIHGSFWVQDAGHRAGEQHPDRGTVLLVRVRPHGRLLHGHVHDDRLGAQQAHARPHGQRVCSHGHGRRVRLCCLRRHTVHRHQLRLAVPYVQSVHTFYTNTCILSSRIFSEDWGDGDFQEQFCYLGCRIRVGRCDRICFNGHFNRD